MLFVPNSGNDTAIIFSVEMKSLHRHIFTAGLWTSEPENRTVFINHFENNYFRFPNKQ